MMIQGVTLTGSTGSRGTIGIINDDSRCDFVSNSSDALLRSLACFFRWRCERVSLVISYDLQYKV